MSIDSADCPRAPDKETQPTEIRVCSVCGTKFCATGDSGFCPVCVLREAENSEPDATESGLESESEQVSTQSKSPAVVDRFENYELVKDQEGKPVELGRGAMGVTYRAFDVDLHCPVTLKVITEKYLDDESARLRFLREARAAASVRHPNVASVFHLGRSGDSYFYAMEFVEGETLEKLIKRMGRVEIKLALEIASQVAAGLAAVHKMDLVHRDIKPTNVMVSLEGTGEITAKIIDLGLAKALNESPSETRISTVGGFVGTPAFASPEHFAGIGVDPFGSLLFGGNALGDGDRPCRFQGFPGRGDVSASARAITARTTRRCLRASRYSPGDPAGERPSPAFSESGRASEGDPKDNERD
jgi:serine/threonine protein kinase